MPLHRELRFVKQSPLLLLQETHGLVVRQAVVLGDNYYCGSEGLAALCGAVRQAWDQGQVLILTGWTVFEPDRGVEP